MLSTTTFLRRRFPAALLFLAASILAGCDLPRNAPAYRYGVPHVEFVKLLEMFSVAESHCKNEGDLYCVPSMRVGAEPWSRIKWKTAYAENYYFDFDVMKKSGYGRRGEVYLSVDGKPTNLELDTILKPVPWSILLRGPTTKMVYHVFLESGYSMEDYIDYGEYLVNKGLATRIELLPHDDSEGVCTTEWYQVKLKGRNPVWLGIMNDHGNAVGTLQMRLDYEKPAENEFWCRSAEELVGI